MGEVSGAVGRVAAAGVGEMPGAYLAALSVGGEDVGLSRSEELRLGSLGLLVLALVRMPDLFLYCHLLEACDLDPSYARLPPAAVVRVRALSGSVVRLAYRALESHVQALGGDGPALETTIRLTDAYALAERLLADAAAGLQERVLLEQAHHGLWALGDATSATGEPEGAVLSERLVDAIARLLVVFLVVSQITVDERPALRLVEGG